MRHSRPSSRWLHDDQTTATLLQKVSLFACGNGRYGATVSAADVESDGVGGYGDGFSEILAGVGPDPNPAVTGKASLYDFDNSAIAFKYEITPYATPYGVNVAGGDMDAGDTEEVVTAPGPDPTAPGRILSWEWDPVIGRNPDGPALHRLGPDDFKDLRFAPAALGRRELRPFNRSRRLQFFGILRLKVRSFYGVWLRIRGEHRGREVLGFRW